MTDEDRSKDLEGDWSPYIEIYEDGIVIYDSLSEALNESEEEGD